MSHEPAPLDARRRDDVRQRLAAGPVDVLVVGGGVTGCGIALDAAARGLSVALLERDDLASGTSSKSSKLIHGGLRYLQRGEVDLVCESVTERDRLRHLAPHLVRPLRFVVPTPDLGYHLAFGVALAAYDVLAVGRGAGRAHRLSPDELAAAVPSLAWAAPGWSYWDARVDDDARLTVTLARAAAALGAQVLTRADVSELRTVADRVVGATVHDRETGDEFGVDARMTISASGVWADRLRGLAGDAATLRPSRGSHVVLGPGRLPLGDAAVVAASGVGDHRSVVAVPDGPRTIVGTTDVEVDSDESPAVTGDDVAYLLHAVRATFDVSLSIDDVIGGWSGLRPLARGDGTTDAEALSRRHMVVEQPPGLVTVTGGKLTTYRRMAADAVDVVAGAISGGRPPRSPTAHLPIGAHGSWPAVRDRAVIAGDGFGIDAATMAALAARHGDAAPRVARLAADHDELDALVDGLGFLTGEVRWAVRAEAARSVDDVLVRRLPVAWRDAAAGGGGVERVAAILAQELGWSEQRAKDEAAAYRAGVAAERGPIPLVNG